jgi:lysophospholipase L1-like esterase
MPPYYVALGDSMSLDLYPQLDLQERAGGAGPDDAFGDAGDAGDEPAPIGAASLLHRNDATLWPEFRNRDLAGRIEGIEKRIACGDGATIGDTLDRQLPGLESDVRAAARVATITAGGNDLLAGMFEGVAGLDRTTDRAIARYRELVTAALDALPSATLVLTTVYDPTDGTGDLPGVSGELGSLPLELLGRFNDAVRALADAHDRTHLADVHTHFLGHGVTAPSGEWWYWEPNPIEPGARGASEIRRVWLRALGPAV